MCNLGLVERGEEGQHADTDTCEEAAGHHHALIGSSGLEDTTEDKDDGADHDGESSGESICDERGGNAANEGAEKH